MLVGPPSKGEAKAEPGGRRFVPWAEEGLWVSSSLLLVKYLGSSCSYCAWFCFSGVFLFWAFFKNLYGLFFLSMVPTQIQAVFDPYILSVSLTSTFPALPACFCMGGFHICPILQMI